MYIGHYGAGLAGELFSKNKNGKRISLGTLLLASQFLDLLFPILVLAGIEKLKIEPGNTVLTPLNLFYYPFSHSFFAALVWAILFGTVYFLIRKNLRGSFLLGILVMSHWFLDFVTHKPDLQIIPWSEFRAGLGLWNHPVAAIILELIIFLVGFYFYIQATKAKNMRGILAAWSLFVFLLLTYSANIFGSAPPSVEIFAYVGIFQIIIIAWAYWIDRNRTQIIPE